jgi:hypothetical protein
MLKSALNAPIEKATAPYIVEHLSLLLRSETGKCAAADTLWIPGQLAAAFISSERASTCEGHLFVLYKKKNYISDNGVQACRK